MSGYAGAMEAAGAKVLAYSELGSYQGEWFAKVEYNGATGFVTGSYGSCSGCDDYDGTFGWEDPDAAKLAEYGKVLLASPLLSSDDAMAAARECWSDKDEAIAFVEANK